MKTKSVYIINSLEQNEFLIFGTYKRAEEWIEKHFNKEIFNKSEQKDLYITKRIVF